MESVGYGFSWWIDVPLARSRLCASTEIGLLNGPWDDAPRRLFAKGYTISLKQWLIHQYMTFPYSRPEIVDTAICLFTQDFNCIIAFSDSSKDLKARETCVHSPRGMCLYIFPMGNVLTADFLPKNHRSKAQKSWRIFKNFVTKLRK